MRLSLCASLLLVSMAALSAAPEQKLDPKALSFFEKRVRPVLVNHCYQCHSADKKIKGGLRLDTKDGVLRGGDSGPAIVPGKPAKSLLITAIRHTDDDLKMPEKKKLPAREIADLTSWVEMGAPDPRVETSKPITLAKIDYEAGRKFWSFIPPAKSAAPPVADADWPRSDVDRFLLASMEAKGLQPVGDADRRTLIRRLTFDLTEAQRQEEAPRQKECPCSPEAHGGNARADGDLEKGSRPTPQKRTPCSQLRHGCLGRKRPRRLQDLPAR